MWNVNLQSFAFLRCVPYYILAFKKKPVSVYMCVFTVTKGETTATNVVFALFAFGTQPSETLILVLYDDEYISKYALFSIKTLEI